VPQIPGSSLPRNGVTKAGRWAVADRDGEIRAVSARCRHQLADLSQGSLDSKGCLVCPWHGSRYDLDTGEMVAGPQGFLNYVGKTPGYTQFIKAYGKVLRLRRRPARREGAWVVVDD
jgi:nitrite reductase/ring-hydroxylating ferredoxin subunit